MIERALSVLVHWTERIGCLASFATVVGFREEIELEFCAHHYSFGDTFRDEKLLGPSGDSTRIANKWAFSLRKVDVTYQRGPFPHHSKRQ